MTTTTTNTLTRETVQTATMAQLVAYYNERAGASIRKFETRAKGIERCLKYIELDASPMAKMTMSLTTGRLAVKKGSAAPKADAPKTKQSVKSKPAPVAKKPVAKTGARAMFAETDIIRVVHKGANPKRGTAAERYELYRDGMTVAAYIAAGGQRRDVVWDSAHKGWIRVEPARA